MLEETTQSVFGSGKSKEHDGLWYAYFNTVSIKFTTFYSVYLTRRLHATVNVDITRYFKMTLIQHQSRTFYLMLKNAEFVVSLET